MSRISEREIVRLQTSLLTYVDNKVALCGRHGGVGDGAPVNEVQGYLQERHGADGVMVVFKERYLMPSLSTDGTACKLQRKCDGESRAVYTLWPVEDQMGDKMAPVFPPLRALSDCISDMAKWVLEGQGRVVALFEPSIVCACALLVKVSSCWYTPVPWPASADTLSLLTAIFRAQAVPASTCLLSRE